MPDFARSAANLTCIGVGTMRAFKIVFLGCGVMWMLVLGMVKAQDPRDIQQQPRPAPTPTDAPTDGPSIESLREPGSTAKLFPDQPVATPASGTPGTAPGVARGAGRGANGQGGLLGRKRNSGRQRDVLVDQADQDPLLVRVAFRRAKTLAMVRDPGMATLLQKADAAGTDPEKRAFLKLYYTRLYDGIGKIDRSPEMKKHLDTLRQVAQSRYDPRRRDVGGDEDIVLGRGGGRRGGGRNR